MKRILRKILKIVEGENPMREKVGVVEIKSKYLLPYIGKTAKVLVLQMTDLEENNYKEKLKKSMNRQRVTLKIGKGKK